VIGILKPVPRVCGNKYGSALLKREASIVQDESSAALENIEGFIHEWMSVDGNAGAKGHLLGAHGELIGATAGADLNKDVAVVTKMDEMFTFGSTEHILLSLPARARGHGIVPGSFRVQLSRQREDRRSPFPES